MEIEPELIARYGGVRNNYPKGSFVFHQGDMPIYFFLIITGQVKVYFSTKEGNIITQGLFEKGSSFGEPPLLLAKPYPSTAQSTQDALIMKITCERFVVLMDENPEIVKAMLFRFAKRIYSKAEKALLLINRTAEEKIIVYLEKVKLESGHAEDYLIPDTRQDIADATGLRVETVIRILIRMARLNQVKIINHKIYF
ncbi:MAG: Crp/Fnr family transcriptional regulator [Saprospiraceae bacterium]